MQLSDSFKHLGSTVAIYAVTALLAPGCGGGDNGDGGSASNVTISNQLLTGKIAGQSWTPGTAETVASMAQPNNAFGTLYSETFAPCTGAAPNATNMLMVMLPTVVGSYTFGVRTNATFFVAAGNQNLVATTGGIRIDSVSSTTISGGLKAVYDDNNSLDGEFEVAVCP